MKNTFAITIAATALFVFAPLVQAGVLEDLLAVPAIQALLGRAPDLQAAVQKCADAKYRQRNAAACQQAEQAARLARVPPELRAVLAVPASSASLRDLCLTAQGAKTQDSYLCIELGKADTPFRSLMDQRRAEIAAAQTQSGQNSPELGR